MSPAQRKPGLTTAAAEAAVAAGRSRRAAATDQVFGDTRDLIDVATTKRAVDACRSKGHAAEGLLVARFNRDAARRCETVRAEWTHLTNCQDPADIRLFNGGRPIGAAQVKTDQDAGRALRALRQDKYDGMQRIVTHEQLDGVRAMAERRPMQRGQEDVLEHLSGELRHGDIRSGMVSRVDAEHAAVSPKTVAARLRATECVREIGGAAVSGAAAGAAMGGVLSVAGNVRAVHKGEKAPLAALVDAAKEAALSGAHAGSSVGLGSAIGIGARRAGARTFARGSGPVAVAACSIEVGGLLRRHLRGDIDFVTLREEVARTSARAGAGYYGAVVGQAVIPIPVVGALVGSIVASVLCDGIVGHLAAERAALAGLRAERERLDALARQARELQARPRAELDLLAAAHDEEVAWLHVSLDDLSTAMAHGDLNTGLAAIRDLQITLGVAPLAFDGFSDAMSGVGARLAL